MSQGSQVSRRQLLLAALGAPLALRAPGLFAATCKTAATSPLGTNYKPDAPARTAYLADPAELGAALRMTGLITAADTCRRLRDATLEVWQADSAGHYDIDAAKLRGKFQTDALGRYRFDTIVPGHVGDGARTIYFRVTGKGYETHITQCFFAGDERERADTRVKPELVVTLNDARDATRPSLLQGQFDIALTPDILADGATVASYAAYAGNYELWLGEKLTIAVDERHLRWSMSGTENPGEPASGLLYARSPGVFFCPEYDYTIGFVKDEQGKVTHALLHERQVAKKIG